jgi:hypothetical protein
VGASPHCKLAPPMRGFFVYVQWLPRGYSRLVPSGNVTGETTLCADFVSLRQWPLLYSFRLPHLPATVMDMAIIIAAMSKTIGTIVSIGMLRSAVVGGAVVGTATAKVPAGGGRPAVTSGFAAKHCNSGCRGVGIGRRPFRMPKQMKEAPATGGATGASGSVWGNL